MGRHSRARRQRRVLERALESKEKYETRLTYLREAEEALSIGGESLVDILAERDRLREQVAMMRQDVLDARRIMHEHGIYRDQVAELTSELDSIRGERDELQTRYQRQGIALLDMVKRSDRLSVALHEAQSELTELRRQRDAVRAYMKGATDGN